MPDAMTVDDILTEAMRGACRENSFNFFLLTSAVKACRAVT